MHKGARRAKGTKHRPAHAGRAGQGQGRVPSMHAHLWTTIQAQPPEEASPPRVGWTSLGEIGARVPLTLEHRTRPGTRSVTYSFQDHSGEQKDPLGG